MYHDNLPEFRKVQKSYAMTLINGTFGGDNIVRVHSYEDQHFRVIFRGRYFHTFQDGDVPSKSQWNTLKKKMKRRNHSVFVFREYGLIDCQDNSDSEEKCFYLDFGFLHD